MSSVEGGLVAVSGGRFGGCGVLRRRIGGFRLVEVVWAAIYSGCGRERLDSLGGRELLYKRSLGVYVSWCSKTILALLTIRSVVILKDLILNRELEGPLVNTIVKTKLIG